MSDTNKNVRVMEINMAELICRMIERGYGKARPDPDAKKSIDILLEEDGAEEALEPIGLMAKAAMEYFYEQLTASLDAEAKIIKLSDRH